MKEIFCLFVIIQAFETVDCHIHRAANLLNACIVLNKWFYWIWEVELEARIKATIGTIWHPIKKCQQLSTSRRLTIFISCVDTTATVTTIMMVMQSLTLL